MKTTYFASCALAAFAICSNAVATEVFIGGTVEFEIRNGEMISNNEANDVNDEFGDYDNDTVTDSDTMFGTAAKVEFKTNTKTRMLEYGAYVNFEFDELDENADVDAHIRVRFAQGTLKFGTDIDGLQGAEDLDWVTVGPESFTASITEAYSEVVPAVMGVHDDHVFNQGVKKSSLSSTVAAEVTAVNESSITFTTNSISGISGAAELTSDNENGDFDWGVSLKYAGEVAPGAKLTAVVGTESSGTVLANAKIAVGDVTVGGMFGKDDDKDKYLGGALAYDLGALTLSAGYLTKKAVDSAADTAKQKDLSLGIAYELAPGLTLDAGMMQNRRMVTALPTLTADRYAGRIKLNF